CLAPRSGCLREHLTLLVRTGDAAEVATLSGASARDEERHLALLGVRDGGSAETEQHQRAQDGASQSVHIRSSRSGWHWYGIRDYRAPTSSEIPTLHGAPVALA